jgi:SAM-dependent methyltransferase
MTTPLSPDPADALGDWAARVRAEREQVERLREEPERRDFYAPMAQMFRADPHRTDDATLNTLLGLVRPGETWLDIGAGGGRFTLPIALRAGRVIAVEPSEGMRGVLQQGIDELGVDNIDVVPSLWPVEGEIAADVAFMSHVGYDIEDIGPFLDAMEASARRLCVAVFMVRQPSAIAIGPLWDAVHGEPKQYLPALREFLALLLARGRIFEVRLADRHLGQGFEDIESAHRYLRGRLWLAEGTAKDQRLGEVLPSMLLRGESGYALPGAESVVGVVSWEPPSGGQ